jgi:hypothetical protein
VESPALILKASGINGTATSHNTQPSVPYRRRHLTSVFDTVDAALNHLNAVKTYVRALVTDANKDGTLFSGVDTVTY